MFGFKKKEKVIIETKKEVEIKQTKEDVYFQLTGKRKEEVKND